MIAINRRKSSVWKNQGRGSLHLLSGAFCFLVSLILSLGIAAGVKAEILNVWEIGRAHV